MSLIFCDRVVHVWRAVEQRAEARIVALTPQVVEACNDRGLPYLLLDSYVAPASVNAVAEATMTREYEWTVWLDARLAEAVPEFGQIGFRPAAAQIAFLKRNLDYFFLPATVLGKFFNKSQPAQAIVFERPPFFPELDTASVQRPLHSLLVPALAPRSTRVEILPDSQLEDAEKLHEVGTRRGYLFLRRTAGRLLRSMKQLRHKSTEGRVRVAWIGTPGEMDTIIPNLAKRGIAVVRPPRSLSAARSHTDEHARVQELIRSTMAVLLDDPRFWAPIDGISASLRSLVGPFMRRWLERDLPRFWAQFLEARDWLSQGEFVAVVGTDVENTWKAALFQAAASLGLTRVIRIHNGGLIQDLPAHDCIGPTQCDVFLVNGDGDVEYFDNLTRRFPQLERGVCVSVGSPRLEKLARPNSEKLSRLNLRLKRADRRPIVLYVPTMLMGCYRYFCEGYMSDTAYIALQERILRCFAEFPSVRVLYKPMSLTWTRDPMRDFIARELPNIEVVSGRLTELMWAVDAVVVDFSATAITEAILTNKPLVLYQGQTWARMVPEAKAALVGRAMISETPDEFERHIRNFLEKGSFDPVTTRATEFIRLYCTHIDDGKSAERMADIIGAYTMKAGNCRSVAAL